MTGFFSTSIRRENSSSEARTATPVSQGVRGPARGDSYGGKGAHGGGAFSGKDPSKVDRSAAYAARHMAKNMVAAGIADEVLIQVSYAIGVAQPVSLFVDTNHTSHVAMSDAEIADKIGEIFDLRPKAIEERLKLRNPIYEETAAYGHMGRQPARYTKHLHRATKKP